jgi:hypothetical protein
MAAFVVAHLQEAPVSRSTRNSFHATFVAACIVIGLYSIYVAHVLISDAQDWAVACLRRALEGPSERRIVP